MQTLLFRRYGWAVIFLVLTSCRSEKVAFQFSPAPVASSAPRASQQTASAKAPVVPASLPVPAVAASEAAAAPAAATYRLATTRSHRAVNRFHKRVSSAPRLVLRPRAETAAARPATPQAGRDTFHLVLGFALVAAGVVAGLLLGGWLGLGVGALVVILGYYFVVLGLGGKHAWLEIFQEFFNM